MKIIKWVGLIIVVVALLSGGAYAAKKYMSHETSTKQTTAAYVTVNQQTFTLSHGIANLKVSVQPGTTVQLSAERDDVMEPIVWDKSSHVVRYIVKLTQAGKYKLHYEHAGVAQDLLIRVAKKHDDNVKAKSKSEESSSSEVSESEVASIEEPVVDEAVSDDSMISDDVVPVDDTADADTSIDDTPVYVPDETQQTVVVTTPPVTQAPAMSYTPTPPVSDQAPANSDQQGADTETGGSDDTTPADKGDEVVTPDSDTATTTTEASDKAVS